MQKRESKTLSSKKKQQSFISRKNPNSERYNHFKDHFPDKAVSNSINSNIPFNFANVQSKLKVSQPGDTSEQEADRVAEQVMNISIAPRSSRPTSINMGGKKKASINPCSSCDMKNEELKGDENESKISRKASLGEKNNYISNEMSNELNSIPVGGISLDSSTKEFMESRFGYDFGNVTIHTHKKASESTRKINALAYTVGDNIVFKEGQYQPNTLKGRTLLAHELTHVIQQANRTSESHLYLKADPAAVAKMDAATILGHPDYFDNNLQRMEFFGAEMARLHYKDGAVLDIGLVPRWIKPPLETVDYHSESHEFADTKGKGMNVVTHPLDISATKGLTLVQEIGTPEQTVRFGVEPESGKIIPNHLNVVTAPFLCTFLRQSEKEYARNFDEIAKGTVVILERLKLIIELMLFLLPVPKASQGAKFVPKPRVPMSGAVVASFDAAAVSEELVVLTQSALSGKLKLIQAATRLSGMVGLSAAQKVKVILEFFKRIGFATSKEGVTETAEFFLMEAENAKSAFRFMKATGEIWYGKFDFAKMDYIWNLLK